MKHIHCFPIGHEKGSTLLVALIILVALSFIGGLALTRTHFELRLSHNDKILTQLRTRATAVALTTAQRLEIMSISDPDRLKDLEEPWLSCGENNAAIDPSITRQDRIKSIVNDSFDPTTWITPEENLANGTPDAPTNSAAFVADEDIADRDVKDKFNEKFPYCEFRVIDAGTAGMSSLGIGNDTKTMHEYYVAGYCADGPQYHIVQLGYKARH